MSAPLLPADVAAELARLREELRALRSSVDEISRQLTPLVAMHAALETRLHVSETARADLAAQAEHLVELLGQARRAAREQRPT